MGYNDSPMAPRRITANEARNLVVAYSKAVNRMDQDEMRRLSGVLIAVMLGETPTEGGAP